MRATVAEAPFLKRLFRCNSGTSALEMAVAAPVLILLVIGLIELGRYMYFGILAAHMAESAVTYGAQNTFTAQDIAGMRSAAVTDGASLSQWIVTPSKICSQNGAAITCPSGTPGANMIYYVQVRVTGQFHSLLNYPGIPTSAPVSAYATARVQSQ